jgi:parallel beta-helix repeat protein
MIRSAAVAASAVLLVSCGKDAGLRPGPDFQKKLLELAVSAKPGTVIELPAGRHSLDTNIQITADNVTLRGKGMDKTILNFKGQKTGANGILASGHRFTLEDLTVQDTKGDAVKINGADGVTVRRVKTEWTEGPKATNGAYGIYPVRCKNVLIEDSVAIAASDAGIYVGQSSHIIVRRNRAEFNVAGIEIENSTHADVYDNVATNNTGGLLIFNLPNLPVQGGSYTRAFNNKIYANNTENFAAPGNTVANVPAGTGLMVMATHHIELFQNEVRDNNSYQISVISYLATGNPLKDEKFYPYSDTIYIHDNKVGPGGTKPDKRIAKLAPVLGNPIPQILWDGVVDPKLGKRLPEDKRICIQNNGEVSFVNYDFANGVRNPQRDLKPHDCAHSPLPPIAIGPAAPPAVSGGM